MLTILHGAVFSKLLQGLNGFDGDTWVWSGHDGDWIYQGGPDTSAERHEVYFNQ
ncbi:hypothetical protein GUITHDRAFT_152189 [Guillardia theta CCMP2712]|uniref:Uncharacterized protein n=2 Tax=Guillardia theta TaxID=55529 RepID=L1JGE2_GUITC|nr:hypothetical protein GUITHDRAFT_152189 [Guillardia theta CCMP2712]EKX47209.1 hypothetical protein GUITHDRAFT_152189 [Guillardia theta CCMP2712]|eukprot:XP_005834189.1 hypothetical protein GUITHDRAFT_152189 [Guillardia theta CCMP2712]